MLILAHNRIRRYEILLDFYKEKLQDRDATKAGTEGGDDKAELLRLFGEILLFELFLREDLKSRPGFASDKPKYNFKDIYDGYRSEHKQVHIEVFSFDPETSAREGRAIKQETILLFDYSRRDPLHYSASYQRLQL